jgi:predicted membrane metal-binding protein
MKILKAFLIVVASLTILFWLVLLFYALLLGGSPGPGYERTTPMSFAGIMAIGLAGAVVGLVGIVKAPKSKPSLIAAAVLGAVGSVPLFLLELPVVGVIVLLIGLEPLLGLLIRPNTREEKQREAAL